MVHLWGSKVREDVEMSKSALARMFHRRYCRCHRRREARFQSCLSRLPDGKGSQA